MIRAKFDPKDIDDYSSKMVGANRKIVFVWELAFKVKGIKHYTTNDIRFPSTDAISINDLNVIKQSS